MINNIMKKGTLFITIFLVFATLMTGCSEKSKVAPEISALSIDSSNTTGAGVTIGSTFNDFVVAYGDYQIQQLNAEGEFLPFSIVEPEKDMPYETEDVTLMVSGFFVDEKPITTEELKELTGEAVEGLSDAIATAEFLQEHKVIYKYVLFTVENNIITDITGDYLDYNEELY